MKRHFVEFPEEKKRSGFYLRFIACFIILSLLELGAAYVWSYFTSGANAPDTVFNSKSGDILFISAALLNAFISYAAARRADRPETVGELIRRRLKGRIKYIS